MDRHGSATIYDSALGFTMEEFWFWEARKYCLVCEHPILRQEDADDDGCLCTGLTEEDYGR
jgi:hypothetical protein